MTIQHLKSRAKRLRPAVEQMLGVKLSHSQTLELVAKEENFPHWDAVCASKAIPKSDLHAPAFDYIRIKFNPGAPANFSTICEHNPETAAKLRSFMASPTGGLVILGSMTGRWLTKTIAKMADEALLHGHEKVDIFQFGPRKLSYPQGVQWKEVGRFGSIFPFVINNSRFVFIDGLESESITAEALALARLGVKVIVGIVAINPLERFCKVLQVTGLPSFKKPLAGVIEDVQSALDVIPIRVRLDAPDAEEFATYRAQALAVNPDNYDEDFIEMMRPDSIC